MKNKLLTLFVSTIATMTVTNVNVASAQSNNDRVCLAQAVYFESRGEPERGKYAVAHVVMNRVESRAYPKTVCGVVHQCSKRGCAFSWARHSYIPSGPQWQRSLKVADDILAGHDEDYSLGATKFHAKYVKPVWSKRTTTIIGGHVFVK